MCELQSIEVLLKDMKNINEGINIRTIRNKNTVILVAYISHINDRNRISMEIIKPLMIYQGNIQSNMEILESVIYFDDAQLEKDTAKLVNMLTSGKCIITIQGSIDFIVTDTTKSAKRSVSNPQVQYDLRAPRDSFTENMDSNISLIKYRIKDLNLVMKTHVVGEKTRTKVVLIYLNGIADMNIVDHIEKELNRITIDGILESSYIEKILNGSDYRIFPITSISERSDKACANILKGRICILVEGSNFALMLPETFIDFLDAGDDHYGNSLLSIFNMILRIAGIIATLVFPALYIVVTSYNPDILPANYSLSIAATRSAVPLNAVIEVLFMSFVTEMLKEASIRLPVKIGAAIGIVGGIVIGQAAIAAGIASPISIVVVAFSTIASFLLPDYTIINPLNVLKILLILLTGMLGFFGFLMGVSFIAITIISQNSFGVSYARPVAPFEFDVLKDNIIPSLRFDKKVNHKEVKDQNISQNKNEKSSTEKIE